MTLKKDFCKRLVYWGQHGPTCWFNAILICMLYSQQSRNLLLHVSKTWDKRKKILKIFRHILKYKYFKSKNPEKDHKFFDVLKPENLLKILHKHDKAKFAFHFYKNGFNPAHYIRQMYELVNTSCIIFRCTGANLVYYDDVNKIHSLEYSKEIKSVITYPRIQKQEDIKKELQEIPDIIAVRLGVDHRRMLSHVILGENAKNLSSLENTIIYNNTEYDLDSIILINWNIPAINKAHAIAGITCKNERYVYNGWTSFTNDPAMQQNYKNLKTPCDLMKFHWDLKTDASFCLNSAECKLDFVNRDDLCFSFNKGERLLLYVKRRNLIDFSVTPKTPEHISFDARKVSKSPLQNTENNQKQPKQPGTKQAKTCPEGKFLNIHTGRCVKNCTDGQVYDLIKKRCISSKNKAYNTGKSDKNGKKNAVKSVKRLDKICPEGTFLNKYTGRCVKNCQQDKVYDFVKRRCVKNK